MCWPLRAFPEKSMLLTAVPKVNNKGFCVVHRFNAHGRMGMGLLARGNILDELLCFSKTYVR